MYYSLANSFQNPLKSNKPNKKEEVNLKYWDTFTKIP